MSCANRSLPLTWMPRAQQAAASSGSALVKSMTLVPARHHKCIRSPKGWRVVSSTIGILPRREWIHACAQPTRTLCGVMMHHARAMR